MLSESGFHRVRRAKSTPSVHKRRSIASVPGPLDSEIARHHATTAATLAMEQAKGRMAQAPQKTPNFSNGHPEIMPSSRALPRHPSIISLPREEVASIPVYNSNNGFTSLKQTEDKSRNKPSPAELSSIHELQGFGFDEDLSAPSSYRRLRKSQSMFTTKSMRNLRVGQPNHSLEEDSPSLRKSMDSVTEPHRSLRHSLSFFNSASHTIQRMKSHSSLSSRRRRPSKPEKEPPVPQLYSGAIEDRPMRRSMKTTVRTLREMSPDDDVLPISINGRFQSKARAFSINIKKRLKRVFGIPSYAESQSSSSSRDGNLAFHGSFTLPDSISRPNIHPVKSSESLAASSSSRVTSWTNSTAGNTVRTRHTIDRHSLSTIEEGGDLANQQSSDTLEMYDNGNIRNEYGRPIDSQRVYSALMRHIGETAARNGEKVVSHGTVTGSPVIMEHSPSIRIPRNHSSIHKMPSDLSMKTARTSFMVEKRPHSSQSHASLRSESAMTDRTVTPLDTKQVHKLSVSSPKVRAKETRPLVFPSSASSRLKTPSPYKTAASSIREVEDDSGRYTPGIIIEDTDTEKPDSISPSIYSRAPNSPAANRDDFGDDFEESFEPGMATIYDAQVPYKSPKRRTSPITQSGPRNSAEWRQWMNYQMDNISNFNTPTLTRQREHHREFPECDGEPIRPDTVEIVDSTHTDNDKNNSLSQLRQIYTSRLNATETDTGSKVQGQNNFSRPISRQSMVQDRSSSNNRRQRSYQETEFSRLDIQKGHQADPFLNETPDEPSIFNHSPSRRLAIRTAREAQLSRGRARRNTLKQTDDQQDAKAVQFRSIREVPSFGKRNKENEISPTVRDKKKAELASLEDLHTTIDSKRMVEMFLDSRRGIQNSLSSEDAGPAFI